MLVCCLTIGHVFWCGDSLSAKPAGVLPNYMSNPKSNPAGVLPHYRPCLLVWWLIISQKCECEYVSKVSMMIRIYHNHTQQINPWYREKEPENTNSHKPAGVVPHYRSCLLVWYLTNNHACWWCVSLYAMLLVRCHCNQHFCYTSGDERGMLSTVVQLLSCHYIRHVCWSGATLRYACLCSETPSDMPAGALPRYQPCLLMLCPIISHAFWRVVSLLTVLASVLPHYTLNNTYISVHT